MALITLTTETEKYKKDVEKKYGKLEDLGDRRYYCKIPGRSPLAEVELIIFKSKYGPVFITHKSKQLDKSKII